MENLQVQKLKLNATNIKNSLIGYNKQLIKLRKDEVNFSFMQEKRKVSSEKEKKIKTKGFFKDILESAKSKILESPMSFFDKIKEFFSIILFGLIINNLPKIISSIQKFFSENKLIFEAIGSTIKIIGDAIMGTIWLVTEYPKSVQQSMMNELDWAGKEFDRIGNTLDGALKTWNDFFNPSSNSSQNSSRPPTRKTPSTTPTPTALPTPETNPELDWKEVPSVNIDEYGRPREQHAKGGTVGSTLSNQNLPPSLSPPSPVPFKKTISTPLGRKAIESVDAFDTFSVVTKQLKGHSILLDERNGINDNFNKVNDSFSEFLDNLGKKDNSFLSFPNFSTYPGATNQTIDSPTSLPIEIDSKYVIGRAGSTGRSTGVHIHFERIGQNKNNLPANVRDNIFVGGRPLSSWTQTSRIGNRTDPFTGESKYHAGEDWAGMSSGAGISLKGGLKFVRYISGNSGYGNQVIIQDANGVQYILGHLSSGPTNQALEEIKKQRTPVQPIQKGTPGSGVSPETGGNDSGNLSMNREIIYVVTQNTIERQPIPVPYFVKVNNTSSSISSNPELNPLLLV